MTVYFADWRLQENDGDYLMKHSHGGYGLGG